MQRHNNYDGNIYRVTHGLVQRPFVEMDTMKRVARDTYGNLKRTMKEIIKPAIEISHNELCKCPYCKAEMIVHNRGSQVPAHLEHKRAKDAEVLNCATLQPSFVPLKFS